MTINNTTIHVLPLGCSFQCKHTPSTSTAIKTQTKCGNMTKRFGTGNKLLLMFPVKAAKLPDSLSSHKLVLNSTIMEIGLSNDSCLSLVVKV